MSPSATEVREAFEFSWSLDVKEVPGGRQVPAGAPAAGKKVARLRYEVKALEEVYIGDKLWDLDPERTRVPDPFGVYRFVRDKNLRLLLGQAPWDERMAIRNVYPPLFSKVPKGETLINEIDIALPVDEYSALERWVEGPTEPVYVTSATLIMEYMPRSKLKEDPKPPPGEGESVGYVVHGARPMISSIRKMDPLPVKLRTEETVRVVVPGDNVEGGPMGR